MQVKAANSISFTLGQRDERPSETTDEWYLLVALAAAPRYWCCPAIMWPS